MSTLWSLAQLNIHKEPVTTGCRNLGRSCPFATDRVPGANASAAIAQPLGSRRFLPWETHDVADPLGGGMLNYLSSGKKPVV